MNLLLRPWRHYADFKGRSRRTEFGLFIIAWYGGLFLLALLTGIFGGFLIDSFVWVPLVAWMLAGFIPGLAVTVRRLHDQDKSGWFILLTFIPYVGFLFWLAIAFWPGTRGENDFGWDPREEEPEPTDRLEQIFS
jgi:uncharacterized membrane protein YhaH (DUF805 family)